MSNVRIEPSKLTIVGDAVAVPDVPGKELLSHLAISMIEIVEEEALWIISLDVPDRSRFSKAAAIHDLGSFEALLASAGQEICKQVAGLQQVRWAIPDMASYFKPAAPGPERADDKPRRKGQGRAGKAPPDKADAVPLSQITGSEKRRITVWGRVVDVVWRQNAAGKFDGIFIITDNSDSIRVRLPFQDTKRTDISPGNCIVARGKVDVDRFDSDPVLVVTKSDQLLLTGCEARQDLAEKKRVELHLHTKMSALDSVLDLESAIKRAGEWGHPALAVTDHGVVQSFPDAAIFGKKYGIKIIYGVEGYLVEDHDTKGQSYHIVILAKNKTGLRHLYELITDSHIRHFYRTPRIPRGLLQAKREGLLLGSACQAGELVKAILARKTPAELRKTAAFYDYLEIQPLENNSFLVETGVLPDTNALAELNRTIYHLGEETGRKCVMTCDAHYLDPQDEIFRTVLLSAKGMANGEKAAPVYLRTTDELLAEASAYLGTEAALEVVVENPLTIADSVDKLAPVPDGSYFPTLKDADTILKTAALEGARNIYGLELPQAVEERLERELSAIVGNGFASLYVIAMRMVDKSKADGYLVGSRGSVGSSLVATCTGITEVNPLAPHYICPNCKRSDFTPASNCNSGFDLPRRDCPGCGTPFFRDGQDIPFETFMGFEGEKVPDIDLNFSGEVQSEIFKFAENLLGKSNVFRAGTISTIARRTAFGFVKHYSEDCGKIFRRAEEIRLSRGMEGVKRTTGQHPGGIMVIPQGMDVLDFTPIQYPADDKEAGAMTTHFDYRAISGRLVKLDILGHDDPTVLKMLHELTGIDPTGVPMDDPGTLELFSGENSQDTVGIPEFGTRFVRNMLSDTKPGCFADLVRISGLSHGTDVWANNARDLIRNGIATLREVISSREDIFLHLMGLGVEPVHAFGIAEKVRKGKPLSLTDIETMHAVGLPDWYIDSCNKITYLFPKAHAAAYVTAAFRIAYFKVHHPLAFAAAYFSFHGSSFTVDLLDQTETQWLEFIQRVNASAASKPKDQDVAMALEVAVEMRKRGVEFLKPSLDKSQAYKYVPRGSSLILPFTSIPGLGFSAASSIIAARNESPFQSVEDFRRRAKIGKKMRETMRKHGLFEPIPESEQLSLF